MVFRFRKKSSVESLSENLSQEQEPLAESQYSLQEWDKLISKAVKWLATEHYFFKEFKQDLEELKSDLEEAKSKESLVDIKKAFKDFRYIGKANRRLERIEEHIEKALGVVEKEAALTGQSEDVEKVRKILHVEVGFLLRDASYYGARIQFYLEVVRKCLEKESVGEAKGYLRELGEVVDACDRWIATLSSSFQKATDLFLRFYHGPLGFFGYPTRENTVTQEYRSQESDEGIFLYRVRGKDPEKEAAQLFEELKGILDPQTASKITEDRERYRQEFAARKKGLTAKLETGMNCQRVLQQEVASVKKEVELCSLIIQQELQAMKRHNDREWLIPSHFKRALGSTLAKRQEAEDYLYFLIATEPEGYAKDLEARKKELVAQLERGKKTKRVLQQEVAWVKEELEHLSEVIKQQEQVLGKPGHHRWLRLELESSLAKRKEAQKYLDYLLLRETLMAKAVGGVSVTIEGGELSVAEEEGRLSLEK